MLKVKSHRRVAGLKPGDYDHEIGTYDNDGLESKPTNGADGIDRVDTESRLSAPEENGERLSPTSTGSALAAARASTINTSGSDMGGTKDGRTQGEPHLEEAMPHEASRPSIEVQEPTPDIFHGQIPHVKPQKPQVQRESAIDILYQNERGAFLCGVALFSPKLLGGLDPTPWTNTYHKPSPTNIYSAQVPDPSWEWAWSEWHVNQQEGMDENGWEYSFAFTGKFSWHGPTGWNSFVRRRAWTRKRVRRRPDERSTDPHMPNSDYFNVRPASERQRSLASSRVPSKASMTQMSSVEIDPELPDIDDIEMLLQRLRIARIDREKLEAVENYLENAMDLGRLQDEMHEIMSLFVFQASRRLLLSHLMRIHDETDTHPEKGDTPESREKREAIGAAIAHADEEVRRLAYWSDVKQMAHGGESTGAVDEEKGWRNGWQGLDDSGPTEPNKGKLPR